MKAIKHSEVCNSQQDRQHGDHPQRATQDHRKNGQQDTQDIPQAEETTRRQQR